MPIGQRRYPTFGHRRRSRCTTNLPPTTYLLQILFLIFDYSFKSTCDQLRHSCYSSMYSNWLNKGKTIAFLNRRMGFILKMRLSEVCTLKKAAVRRLTFCRTRFERLLGSLLFVLTLFVPGVNRPLRQPCPHHKENEVDRNKFVNLLRPQRVDAKHSLVKIRNSCVINHQHKSKTKMHISPNFVPVRSHVSPTRHRYMKIEYRMRYWSRICDTLFILKHMMF